MLCVADATLLLMFLIFWCKDLQAEIHLFPLLSISCRQIVVGLKESVDKFWCVEESAILEELFARIMVQMRQQEKGQPRRPWDRLEKHRKHVCGCA